LPASGILFGLSFSAIAHWLAGPALGLKVPGWRPKGKVMAMHALSHVGLDLLTAPAERTGTRLRGSQSCSPSFTPAIVRSLDRSRRLSVAALTPHNRLPGHRPLVSP